MLYYDFALLTDINELTHHLRVSKSHKIIMRSPRRRATDKQQRRSKLIKIRTIQIQIGKHCVNIKKQLINSFIH